jgi:3,4-dihydroxy 2-butanone 4-phosphate synthase/GTP cyclohydrolase II
MNPTELRRHNLRLWIDRIHQGRQALFVAETGINQGELSALLKNKAFGERKARKIEQSAGMPALWLDTPQDTPATPNTPTSTVSKNMQISPIPEILADIKAGKMVIITDAEDRENEGDLIMAAQFVTPQAINFMIKHARGLVCLPMNDAMVDRLNLPQMTQKNGAQYGTNFTVSIEAANGISTGISAADRALTIQTAVSPNVKPEDIVQPGHIFPLRSQKGGVLVRAGHTEAAVDLAEMSGLSPAGVICEILNDDGTMARLPDLQLFAAEHGLKIGTIADLIEYRSRTESLVEKVATRPLRTAHGEFVAHAYRDQPSGSVHLALVLGQWQAQDAVPVRVHEPLSVLDALALDRNMHSWSLDAELQRIQQEGRGVVVLLNCGETAEQLLAQFEGTARASHAPERGRMDLRTYGVGAQILRDCGVQKMALMGQPRRMPSMAGYGLEITGFIPKE